MKKIESIRKIEENKSKKLRTFPVKINILFRNNNPAQKRVNDMMGAIPNISIKKINADARSIPPSTLTSIIILKIWS